MSDAIEGEQLRDHLRATEREIPLLHLLGCELLESEDPEVVRVAMRNDASTQNRMGTPHGGALAALADHAGGLTAALLAGRGGPTSDLHIRFLAAAEGDQVVAECRLLRVGRRLVVVDVRMYDAGRRLLATASVTTAPFE
jgi:uncharacterized protein (TIGR00369 family)